MPQKRTPSRSRLIGGHRDLAPLPHDDGAPEPPHAHDEAPGASYAVYFITSAYLEPLYIGCTGQLIQRLQQHARERDWFTTDCRIFVEWFHSEADARLRETHAIHEARPKYNRRFDQPSQPCPEPDVPLRPLIDMDRDIAALCRNCGMGCVHTRGLCHSCNRYLRTYGVDRPAHLFVA